MGTRKKPLHASDVEQFRAIGQAVRNTRHGRHTLEALASRAGISIGQLSQIENGRGNPTVEMLIRIGASLDVDVVDLIEQRAPRATHIVRATERRRHALSNDHEVTLLTPGLRHEFSVTYIDLEPDQSLEGGEYRGDNFIYVVRGPLLVHAGDNNTYVLEDEESMVSRSVRRLTNSSSHPVSYISGFRPEDD